jgi:hypothetical protein
LFHNEKLINTIEDYRRGGVFYSITDIIGSALYAVGLTISKTKTKTKTKQVKNCKIVTDAVK